MIRVGRQTRTDKNWVRHDLLADGEQLARLIRDTRPDPNGDPTRAGYAVEAHYGSWVTLYRNTFVRNPHTVGAFLNSALVQAAD